MENAVNYETIPYQYSLCLNQQCPKADECLRRVAAQSVPQTVTTLTILNPAYLQALEGDCPHFRPLTTERYARGFVGILERAPHKQMLMIIGKLKSTYSHINYYRRRNGTIELSPTEQAMILDVVKSCGIAETETFDAYFDSYNW